MNVETGEVIEFSDEAALELAKQSSKLVELQNKPNKNCKQCYGRGYTGYNRSKGEYVICRCVKRANNFKKELPDCQLPPLESGSL